MYMIDPGWKSDCNGQRCMVADDLSKDGLGLREL